MPAGASAWAALEALRADAGRHLVAYQGRAWARRFDALVARAAERERELGGDGTFTLAVARSLRKLMTYKDEYEVARLYSDGSFAAALSRQFEGDLRLRYHMAPPLLSRSVDGKPPRKIALGSWMGPAMRLLAHGRHLRGTFLDPFGYTAERRTERELIAGFERRIGALLPVLTASNLPIATQLAAVPLSIRGFGHVKLGNLALARIREAELLHRLDPERHPAPPRSGPPPAGQLRGIQVVARA